MDMAAWSWNGGEEQPVQEVLRVDDAVRDLLGIERRGGEMLQPWFAKNAYSKPYGTLRLKYRFNCEVLPKGQVYLAGERPQEQRYSINGVTLTAPGHHRLVGGQRLYQDARARGRDSPG